MGISCVIGKLKKGVVEIAALSLVLLTFLCGAGQSAGEPAGLIELRRIYSTEGLDEAWEYLAGLPSLSQLEVAGVAAADSDKEISALGITALVQSGNLDEAVPTLALRVAGGDDLSAFGYAWAHADDPKLPVRMYLKICRYQLANLDRFKGEQRKNVERFLTNGGAVNPLNEFSLEAVEERLSRIEARLLE
ncbi:MAG: hypothetical protein OEY01_15220 [Desulfobulbaceae bacterium]|nr:hypothetical protein [Desulfobulbaceae bacterium]HIJ79926.1 hypothetical protein [Deltaproteobacteria bacterium]